ncbi:hypothetical protein MCFN_03200 [Mycoplasmopsis californica]|uniref:Choline kinase n=1 Tax=Mycoplasmopsis californica TaxID=2113 RepID=A0A059XX33_9BACT|nr:phosphotransferase [Mycoplasmopsis californica]AIA29752.1 hypothetical protein MCFN_03200 [Mycoplasmopsis californica]
MYTKFIENKIPKDIYKQLENIEFIYKGFHNYTFKCLFQGIMCQLRLPISDLVNHDIEARVLSHLSSTIYYKDGILIRKWFEGQTLEKINLTQKIQRAVIQKIKEFHKMDIEVPQIDLFTYGRGTEKYQKLVQKYSKTNELVTSHSDLSAKNVLINDNGEIELIDFEWVRKAHPFFDALTLVQAQNFDKEIVMQEFNISAQEFEEMSYITDEFRENAYKIKYSNIAVDDQAKQLTQGYTNTSFVKNDLFIQKKHKNAFNHLNPLKIFDKLEPNEKVIYEDEQIIIRKFINNKEFSFDDTTIQEKIVKAIAQLHTFSVKLQKNQIAERIKYYVNKLKNHEKYNACFSENLKQKIIDNSLTLPNEVPSHNDLNRENIILNTSDQIKFIDFEYCSMNSKYFDLAYHCSDLDYDVDTELKILNLYAKYTGFSVNLDEYYRVKAIVNFYGISWSLTYNPDFNFDWLAKHVFVNIKFLK